MYGYLKVGNEYKASLKFNATVFSDVVILRQILRLKRLILVSPFTADLSRYVLSALLFPRSPDVDYGYL